MLASLITIVFHISSRKVSSGSRWRRFSICLVKNPSWCASGKRAGASICFSFILMISRLYLGTASMLYSQKTLKFTCIAKPMMFKMQIKVSRMKMLKQYRLGLTWMAWNWIKWKAKVFLVTLPRVNLRGASLEFTSKIVNLGLRITSTLHWLDQVRYISMRVYTTLRSLRFHRRAFSRDLRKKLVESLIFPYFDYASTVFQDLHATLSKSLENLLNSCVRFVIGCIPFGSSIRRSKRHPAQALFCNFFY